MCTGKNESKEKGKHVDEIDLHISIFYAKHRKSNPFGLWQQNKLPIHVRRSVPYKRYACATDALNSSQITLNSSFAEIIM